MLYHIFYYMLFVSTHDLLMIKLSNKRFSEERNRGFDGVVLEPTGLVGTTPIQHALMPDISQEKHDRPECAITAAGAVNEDNISRIQVP